MREDKTFGKEKNVPKILPQNPSLQKKKISFPKKGRQSEKERHQLTKIPSSLKPTEEDTCFQLTQQDSQIP